MTEIFKEESNIDDFETKVEIFYIKEEICSSSTEEDKCTIDDSCTVEDTCTVKADCTEEDICSLGDTFTEDTFTLLYTFICSAAAVPV